MGGVNCVACVAATYFGPGCHEVVVFFTFPTSPLHIATAAESDII